MEKFLLIILGIVAVTGVSSRMLANKKKTTQYKYRPKPIMTHREEEAFRYLVRIFDQKFYVIPQVYLGSILNHEIKGQNWQGAFQHINRKSVDYVLLNKETLKVVCAVELDDRTHDSEKRQKRDAEVERILKGADIPLVRTRNLTNRNEREVIALFAEAINGT